MPETLYHLTDILYSSTALGTLKHYMVQHLYVHNIEFTPPTALCVPPCQNGGFCVLPNLCSCVPPYAGFRCESK